jgi:hypothetical protein
MTNLTLRLGDNTFHLPKKPVIENCELFETYPDLYDEPIYEIQCEVDPEDFSSCANFLQTRDESLVTTDNCASLRELACEFGDSGLLDLCSQFQAAEATSQLIDRLSAAEESILQQCDICEILARDLPRTLCDFVASQMLQLSAEVQALRKETEDRFAAVSAKCRSDQAEMTLSVSNLGSELRDAIGSLRTELQEMNETVSSRLKLFEGTEYPMKGPKSLDGIISYLTKTVGGNVHDRGIVTITSKSVAEDCPNHVPKNLADLTSDFPPFWSSRNGDGQWVCWDFHEMRVRPTNYTIRACHLGSWVVEGSLDGESWTELHRRTGRSDIRDYETASFIVAKPACCRFIRLTRISPECTSNHQLIMAAVEFFGILAQ